MNTRLIGPGRAVRISAAALTLAVAAACGSDSTAPASAVSSHHPAGVIFSTDTIGGAPFGVAVSSAGVVFVTQRDSNEVSTFSLSGSRAGRIHVGYYPLDVAFSSDGQTAYETDEGSHTMTRIDVATSTRIDTTEFDDLTYRVRVRDGRIFVTDQSYHLTVLDGTSLEPLHAIRVGETPNGIAFAPDGSQLFVSNFVDGTVNFINLHSFTVVDTLHILGYPQDIAVTPDGADLYIADAAGAVQIWSTARRSLEQAIPMPGPVAVFGLRLTPDGKQAWVSSPQRHRVYIIDTESRSIVDTLITGGTPRRIDFNKDGTIGVITNEDGWVDFVN